MEQKLPKIESKTKPRSGTTSAIPMLEKIYGAWDDAIVNSNEALLLKSIESIKMWFTGKVTYGNSDSVRNEYLRKTIQAIFAEVSGKGRISVTEVSELFSRIIYSPPFPLEPSTWDLLMRILPKFVTFAGKGKQKMLELSMHVFLCSGLQTPKALQLLSEKPIDKYWEDFVGILFSIAIFKTPGTNGLYASGVWSRENPAPKEFALLLLKTMLNREMTQDVRSHCLFSIIRSFQTAQVGLFRFLMPIDTILSSFGDAVFPFDHLLPEFYKDLFDLFGQGKAIPGSKWLQIFANSIRKELLKNRPASVTNIIRYFSHVIFSRPEFVLTFSGDSISAIGTTSDIDFTSLEMDLLCCNLCELLNLNYFNNYGKKEFFQLMFSKIIHESSNYYHLLYITLFTKHSDYQSVFVNLLTRQHSPEIILLLGFAAHVFPSFVTPNLISHLIEKVSPEMYTFLALMLIEILTYVEAIRKDEQCISIINDFVHNLEDSLLRQQLQNIIAFPLRYQLNASDIEAILPRQKDYYRFNSTIISSEFIDDENAIIVCRNRLSMSAYRLSPIPNAPLRIDEPSPLSISPSADNPFTPYKPIAQRTRKRDTFYLLSAFGLFTQSNQYNITPLDNASIAQLKDYEQSIGRMQYVISMTRLTSNSNELFCEKSSSDGFNEFISNLGHFLRKQPAVNGLVPTFSVSYYDTALFRFLYCSKLHFDKATAERFDPTNSFALVIFNESPAEVYSENPDFSEWNLVISVRKVMENLYSMNVLKCNSSLKAPFCNNFPRLVAACNLADEVAFVLYSYIVSNIRTLYIREFEENRDGSLFKAHSDYNGIELLSKIFGN
ncbi:hypothetical protein GPJ56_001950 [Histomonas meleagridis]|uniref:uncharacterized protein n=1 Tax=Histomonas meleagridis TaxID=135588 RepID=UPI0035595E75|nr:hypothetical protein GPJ56_001950 [Histomonas meleagridis]KAH0800974.1 hypothetical protein GO595_006290 [Histomonas meleagridis]